MKFFAFLSAAVFAIAPAVADEVTLRSGARRRICSNSILPEGCSSCPPAEKWMSQLKGSLRVWKEIVPVAFHVDYWDGLGWPDRFAKKAFTARQRTYAAAWGTGTVYTPGFVLDGREWRDRGIDQIPAAGGNAGVLSATIRDRKAVNVVYQPPGAGKWETHVAVLGFGLNSNVKAGENSGRKLLHDFVVLAQQSKPMFADGSAARAELVLEAVHGAGELGLAVWITEAGQPQPVQALGGKL